MAGTSLRFVVARLPLLLARLMEICWLCVVGVVPLFFIPHLFRPFYPPKAFLLQFLALMLLAAAVGRWFLLGRGVTRQDAASLCQRRVYLAALAFAAIAVVATLLSLSPWTSLTGSVNRRQGLLTILSWLVFFFVLSSHLRTRAQLGRLAAVLLASSGIVSLIGILEHYVPSFSESLFNTAYSSRSSSTTGNALSLSAYLGMAIPFTLAAGALVYRHHARLVHHRFLLGSLAVLLMLQTWCLVLSIYSYVLLLYLVPAVLFTALLSLSALRRRALTLAVLGLLAVILATGGIIVLPQWQNAVHGTAPYDRGTPLIAGTSERLTGTLYGRARYWVYALDVLPQASSETQPGDSVPALRPLIGYGPETYMLATQRHFPPEYLSGQTNSAVFRDRAHNHFIDLAITTGFLGLAAWLALVAGCLILLYRLIRREDAFSLPALLGLAAGCAVIGFLGHAVFNPIAFAEEALFWTCLALAPALAAMRGRTASEAHAQPVEAEGLAPGGLRRLLACLLVGCAAIGGLLAAHNPLMAERTMRQAAAMSASGNPGAVFMYSRAAELQPGEPTYWGALGSYAYGVALKAAGEAETTVLELSLIALQRARDNEPLFYFGHYQLGDALLYAASATGQVGVEQAVECYERALELSPRNAVLADRIAVAHMVQNDRDRALQWLKQATEYDPWLQEPRHLEVALVALEGGGASASRSLLELVREEPAQLRTFARACASRLLAFDLVNPMAAAMLPALEAEGDEWAALAVRGVLVSLTGEAGDAAALLTSAADRAPAEDIPSVQSTASYLAGLVPGLRDALTQA